MGECADLIGDVDTRTVRRDGIAFDEHCVGVIGYHARGRMSAFGVLHHSGANGPNDS